MTFSVVGRALFLTRRVIWTLMENSGNFLVWFFFCFFLKIKTLHDLCQGFTGLLWNPVKQELTSIPWNPSGLKLFENANEQVEDCDPCMRFPYGLQLRRLEDRGFSHQCIMFLLPFRYSVWVWVWVNTSYKCMGSSPFRLQSCVGGP